MVVSFGPLTLLHYRENKNTIAQVTLKGQEVEVPLRQGQRLCLSLK